MQRRNFLAAGALLPAASAWLPARAADWPAKPIQVIVPYAAGGADNYIRPLQPALDKKHGITLVIESLGGAGGTIGSGKVKRAAADGYTLLFCGSGALTIAPRLQESGAPGPAEFTPIMNLTTIPYVVAVRKDSPIKTGKEFLDFIKKNPGKLNYGTPGTGSAPHLGMEALAKELGTSMTHVPFAGISAAVQSLLGGHIDAVLGAPSNVLPQVKAGELRGLAVTSKKRFPFAPDLPTMAELGADVDVVTHFGFLGPKGLPAPVVQKLAAAIRDAAADPAYVTAMQNQQTPIDLLSGEELAKALAQEESRFAPVIEPLRKK
ncbi:tripartite tricarboxylate transporter substrate binding protein [Ramlibacter sp. G-1-2-2]|uniref:Tripartite tricarboxylate transporter substrate binding protein n=1 Tax=Ramlibacter agri TaxID=2728837 RepID=A0A848HGH8_9BURK|nr:tripartite tricarboxylate transporter substrate binding protein [Ramlibacter agri]NML48421.1 tripartite tricarboxylate transporter substrate binding protein [Ramlibacter agri]